MVKATLKGAVLLFLAAIGMAATSVPSFAEVQNVKVGGDLTVRAFHRENLDLNQEDSAGSILDDSDDFIQQTTGINIGADLTENVSTFIRLTNESRWGTLAGASGDDGDFGISQGLVKITDAFYSPVDVTVGRQPIVWGRGFVLGSNLIPGIFAAGDRHANTDADEFTDFTAFDAFRATADLSGAAAMDMPLTIDTVYIKQVEGTSGASDDTTIMGVNLGTRVDAGNSEFETYYLNKRVKGAFDGVHNRHPNVHTLGLRGSSRPVDGWYLYGEAAYQFGGRDTDIDGNAAATLPVGDSQQAWAFNLGADYTLADVAMTPKVGAEWIYFSGKDVDGASQGWDPIARGYFTTAIREFQTGAASGFYGTDQANDTSSATNQHQLSLYGSFNPIEDLKIDQRYSWFILPAAQVQAVGGQNERNRYAGFEWDTIATYNYTEDVQFGVIYALFAPGDVYQPEPAGSSGDSTAQELISSVSVKF